MSSALCLPVVLVSVLAFGGEQAAPQYTTWMGVRETGWMRSQEMRTPGAIQQAQRDPKEGPPKPIPLAPPSPPGTSEKKPGGAAGRSGLTGTTSSRVMSGVPGGQTTGRPSRIEFAIASLDGEQPVYDKAILVTSNPQGQYEVAVPPGRYWIGPKAKARNPTTYRPGAMEVPEEMVVVQARELTQLNLVAVGYAP